MRFCTGFIFSLSLTFAQTSVFAQTHMPQITVTGNAEVSVEPDMATIRMALRTQAPDSVSAKQLSDERLNSFLDRLEELGIDEEQIRAGSLNINAQYDYSNRQQRFIGFQASRDISVEIDDLDMLHPILDAAVEERIDGINGIQYQSSRQDELLIQARNAAIEDSKQKAKELAEAYDAQLGPIYNISYHAGNISVPAVARMESASLMAEDASTGARFIPGDITITDRISVVFDLITH